MTYCMIVAVCYWVSLSSVGAGRGMYTAVIMKETEADYAAQILAEFSWFACVGAMFEFLGKQGKVDCLDK